MIEQDAQQFAQELVGNIISGRYGSDYETAKEIAFEYMGTFYGEQYPQGLTILDEMLPKNNNNGII